MLGIVGSACCLKAPGRESLVISCGRHFPHSRSAQPKRGDFSSCRSPEPVTIATLLPCTMQLTLNEDGELLAFLNSLLFLD
jgi:hypothetical protein